jgi:hypothetical protein
MNRAARKYCLAWGIPPAMLGRDRTTLYDRLWWRAMRILHPRHTDPTR